ncbi:MAG: hypothetical protein D6709_01270 [Chloroflexi bacterium]|uniref:Uncharacterized protein n=1 Tax=Candidatus Thermofonsia Clade 3 bacterium TaxID=2364212 RepID=A0A2M8QAX5_9CHLR|nr:MAG: hypothetical protein CUN48_11175 [Candidatus Thermofonsia Clade 3 bacterium]RMG65878.1 MAG: hypothetical protein D6709_01270 [Chloroflexota bacterium]
MCCASCRVRSGVIAGIEDYGNKMGIPATSGAMAYDAGDVANPLVYGGCVGIAPVNAHPRPRTLCSPNRSRSVISNAPPKLIGGRSPASRRDGASNPYSGASINSAPHPRCTSHAVSAPGGSTASRVSVRILLARTAAFFVLPLARKSKSAR